MSKLVKRQGVVWSISGIIAVMAIFLLTISSDCDSSNTIISDTQIAPSNPPIPDTFSFCGERIPLEFFDVRESLERELLVNTYYHSQTILLIKKANRFFPEIEPILKEHNIPDDFKYLALAESGLANVVSPSRAVGFWQLLEGTAKDYGLEVNEEVDERYHLEKATIAACNYLNESYKKYNNWTLAAASYNVGRKGVDRQISRQKETDYYNLLFNEETARYVYRIIALKLVITDPEKYNFILDKEDLYEPISYKEIKVDTPVDSWADFAQKHHTNYKILKLLNPWLRDKQLTNKLNKDYVIRVPRKKARKI
jgi:membrane-bound lytic murein transglycosylase D